MRCPYCESPDTKVIDSRPTEEGHAIRRRRGCEKCGKRFTTYEKVEESIIMIIKKDGRREAFDRNKVMNGIIKACEKRPVPMAEIERVAAEIERGLNNPVSYTHLDVYKRQVPKNWCVKQSSGGFPRWDFRGTNTLYMTVVFV